MYENDNDFNFFISILTIYFVHENIGNLLQTFLLSSNT